LRKLLLTGFVVFFYEGSALQLLVGLVISIIFAIIYSKLDPYLMPSNNTFATYAHFNISFTLVSSLMLMMDTLISEDQRSSLQFSKRSISISLLLSNGSVLVIGGLSIVSTILTSHEVSNLIKIFKEGAPSFSSTITSNNSNKGVSTKTSESRGDIHLS